MQGLMLLILKMLNLIVIIRYGLNLLWSRLPSLIQKPDFKSTVGDLVDFELINCPSWRKGEEETIPKVNEMIDQIIRFQKSWSTVKSRIPTDRMENIRRKFKERYCDINTDPLEESGYEQKKEEMRNLQLLLEFFDNILEQETKGLGSWFCLSRLNCCGLIEKSLVQEAHKIAVRGKEIKKGCTKPGQFSNLPRYTTHYSFNGRYYYKHPSDMVKEVDLLLDRFNSLITEALGKSDEREKLSGIVKSLAFFLFQMLDLHPFGNGNGRIFRLFCHYVLRSCGQTFVPCPIYRACTTTQENDHSTCLKPCKDTYERSLINARGSTVNAMKHPQELATIIVESVWRTWFEFMHDINNGY